MKQRHYDYFSDGSNSHNKGLGPAGAAFVVSVKGKEIITQRFMMQQGTNNDAEMLALCEAIEHFAMFREGLDTATFHADSQWAVYTVAGWLDLPEHPVKYGLTVKSMKFKPLLQRIEAVWDSRYMTLMWVRREENEAANQAANEARIKAMKEYNNGT